MGATFKQIRFIEFLMKTREIGDLYESTEARTVRAGIAEEMSRRQASEFIDMLLTCPEAN